MIKLVRAAIPLAAGLIPTSAIAQAPPSRTYFGWDGRPQSGGNTYIATTYGDAIEIMPRDDQCGRPYFIQGVLSVAPNLNRGTIAGAMKRCTTRELIASCGHTPHYEIGFDGTVTRDETHRRLYLNLTYRMEIWNEDTCEKEREELQREIVELLYIPPTPPQPTTAERLGGIADDSRQILIDSFWTLGGLSPR